MRAHLADGSGQAAAHIPRARRGRKRGVTFKMADSLMVKIRNSVEHPA
jgi:hypothetical protein